MRNGKKRLKRSTKKLLQKTDFKIKKSEKQYAFRIFNIKITNGKRKAGHRSAGVEPDNLAGTADFIIPPLRLVTKYLFSTTLYILKQGNNQKVQCRALTN